MEEKNFLLKVAILKGWKVYNYVNDDDICEKHMKTSVHKLEKRLDRSAVHFSNTAAPPPPNKNTKKYTGHI